MSYILPISNFMQIRLKDIEFFQFYRMTDKHFARFSIGMRMQLNCCLVIHLCRKLNYFNILANTNILIKCNTDAGSYDFCSIRYVMQVTTKKQRSHSLSKHYLNSPSYIPNCTAVLKMCLMLHTLQATVYLQA